MVTKTASINVRVNPFVKKNAEKLFESFGITLSDAINMFLNKSLMEGGLPFDLKQTHNKPLAFAAMSKEQFDSEIARGMNDLNNGEVFTSEEVKDELKSEFGL